jgi:hypothetical protein
MLLALLENRLHGAVSEAVNKAVQVDCGPTLGPASDAEQVVEVAVRELKATIPSSGEEAIARRERARLSRTHTWDASGKQRNFTLPEDVRGEVAEVEAPPGHPVTTGDDYFLEGRTVRFYRPPAKGTPGVSATLHGDPSIGYSESHPCRILANLTVWAKTIKDADEILTRSFNAILAAFVDIGNISSPQDDSGVSLRLLKPVAVPDSIERSREKIGRSLFYRATAQIAVFGELELTVALGAEKPEAIIEEIEYQTQPVKGSAGA